MTWTASNAALLLKNSERCLTSSSSNVANASLRRSSRKRFFGVETIRSPSATFLIFGANTDVGKTVLSTGLVDASLRRLKEEKLDGSVHYIKPLQCGGSDEAFVRRYTRADPQLKASTLFRWETPASPHVASRKEKFPVSDVQVTEELRRTLSASTATDDVTWIETAGGVLSPSSASPGNDAPHHTRGEWGWTTQASLYRSISDKIPVVLVGDGRLGGISATITALESLLNRGYHVWNIVLIEDTSEGYGNAEALREYVDGPLGAFLPETNHSVLSSNPDGSVVALPPLPPMPEPLGGWYERDVVRERLSGIDTRLHRLWSETFSHTYRMVDNSN